MSSLCLDEFLSSDLTRFPSFFFARSVSLVSSRFFNRFDALYIVPVFQSFWILISVLAGLIFFGEYAEMSELQSAMFPVGIALTIVGVYFLSQRGVDEGKDWCKRTAFSFPANYFCSPYVRFTHAYTYAGYT